MYFVDNTWLYYRNMTGGKTQQCTIKLRHCYASCPHHHGAQDKIRGNTAQHLIMCDPSKCKIGEGCSNCHNRNEMSHLIQGICICDTFYKAIDIIPKNKHHISFCMSKESCIHTHLHQDYIQPEMFENIPIKLLLRILIENIFIYYEDKIYIKINNKSVLDKIKTELISNKIALIKILENNEDEATTKIQIINHINKISQFRDEIVENINYIFIGIEYLKQIIQ